MSTSWEERNTEGRIPADVLPSCGERRESPSVIVLERRLPRPEDEDLRCDHTEVLNQRDLLTH